MSTGTLSQDVAALSDDLRATFQLIARLSKSGVPLGDADTELTVDIHESLKQHEEALEALNQELEDVTTQTQSGRPLKPDSEKARQRIQLVARIARLGEDVKHARGQFRKAQLTARRAAEAAKRQEREAFFASLRESNNDEPITTDSIPGRRQKHTKELTEDELLINASSDVTQSLRRTHDLLATELTRSRFAAETLEESTAALAELGQRYGNLDDLLSSSKNLLGTLVKSQKSDTWYLETAFYLLAVTITWLFFRRVIYGPAWWFVWLPLKHLLLRPVYYLVSTLGGISAVVAVPSSSSVVSSRTPLKVQPSASGGIPKFDHPRPQISIPAGAGGGGAKVGQRGRPESRQHSVVEQIGRMTEGAQHSTSSKSGEHEQSHDMDNVITDGNQHVVKRGDGTVLKEREAGDRGPNPKKKMFEDDGSRKDEL